MKKVFIVINLVLLLFLTSCKKDYVKTLENYLKYLRKGNYKEAYTILSSRDKNVVSYQNFSNNDNETPISRNIGKRILYKIKESSFSETGTIARVNVLVKKIDLKKAYYLIPELMNENLSEKDIDRVFRGKNKILKSCYISNNVEYKLILEDNEWKIFADFERKKSISILLDEADEYFKNNDYNSALKLYEDVLDFDESNINALDNLMQIKEKLNYTKNFLEINHRIFEKNEKGAKIALSMVNNGTIVVKSIFIDFVFYDSSNKVIFQSKKEVLNNLDKKLGYHEGIDTIINFDNIKNFHEVKCVISAIDF